MNKPNLLSPRLFKNPALEALSRVKSWMPIALWGPTVLYFFLLGRQENLSSLQAALLTTAGLFIWTLTEYGLHRFVFHWDAKTPVTQRFVFLLHGVHHDFPNDPDRLLMPPSAALPFAVLFGILFRAILGPHFFPTFFGAFLTGYLIYDYTHFASHYSDRFASLFPAHKKRHMVHHFVKPDKAYGVSSPLWDHVFGTHAKVINRKKSARPIG